MKPKPQIIVIVGQTATGKSDFAVQLANELAMSGLSRGKSRGVESEIISADSRQVYKGLDIGTGKVPRDKRTSNISTNYSLQTTNYFHKGVPHHLLDVANAKKVFSVSDFKALGEQAIQNILQKNKVPIICGGTGFYIDTLVNNTLLPEVPPNKKLRAQNIAKNAIVLFAMLQKLDPARAKTIDKNNPVRLIRAIEIATALGSVPKLKNKSPYDVLWIGLTLPDEILKEKIHMRLFVRIGKYKMLDEARKLHTKGLSWKRMQELGLEYRYMALYLSGKISKAEMVLGLESAIWHYAKRQKTWFKRNKEITWIDPRKKSDIQKTFKNAKEFISKTV